MSTFPVSIAESEEEQVRELAQMMIRLRAALIGPDDHRQEIPDSVYRLLLSVLKIMQQGKAVSIVPQMQQLTTRRAANLLGVSRQFFVRLLDDQKLPFHRTGTHRRVKDVLKFRKRRDQQRKGSIARIAKEEVAQGTYGDFPLPIILSCKLASNWRSVYCDWNVNRLHDKMCRTPRSTGAYQDFL
jgi:excisionase family DNA binding protein